eukprot:m.176366 g.176366  ORF g.176366 m.176366 type:complete len:152 (+) comp25308_c0_seq1:124-579(+)
MDSRHYEISESEDDLSDLTDESDEIDEDQSDHETRSNVGYLSGAWAADDEEDQESPGPHFDAVDEENGDIAEVVNRYLQASANHQEFLEGQKASQETATAKSSRLDLEGTEEEEVGFVSYPSAGPSSPNSDEDIPEVLPRPKQQWHSIPSS